MNKPPKLLPLLCAFMVSVLLVACAQSEVSEYNSEISEGDGETVPITELIEETAPDIETLGRYTLDDCMSQGGMYIRYEDGSFDRYRGGGYCHEGGGTLYGLYLPNRIEDELPVINANKQLVIFANSDYGIRLYTINAEIPVIQLKSENGVEGYGRIDGMNERMLILAVYEDHERTSFSPLYVNGEPSGSYNAEIISWEATPYKGRPNEKETYLLYGFQKNTTVTLGVGEGTTLIETTYLVDATYYHCNNDYKNWQDAKGYIPTALPTANGYAVVDFEDIPSGKYVIIYAYEGENGNTFYNASVLFLEND